MGDFVALVVGDTAVDTVVVAAVAGETVVVVVVATVTGIDCDFVFDFDFDFVVEEEDDPWDLVLCMLSFLNHLGTGHRSHLR